MGSVPLDGGASSESLDIAIIGAGISGVNAGYRVQEQLPHMSYTIFEARNGMGGTWDLFKYPGIRSDSDLHTFGFPWRPWSSARSIADGKAIVEYIRESAEAFGIDKHIQYHHRLLSADWSSDEQAWRLVVEANGQKKYYHAKFVIMSTGYYDYNEPLQAKITGLENFTGQIVHPQFWPEDLDYANKKVAIIGSGATAITLLPNLTDKAAHVTMVQRSPSYIISLPQPDPSKSILGKILPTWVSHKLQRISFLVFPWLFFNFCRNFPNAARWVLRRRTTRQLPKDVPHDPHFNPSYNPWEQRLCVCPDGDFYKCLHQGKASVATGHIKTMKEKTIVLENGQTVDADIIITATGLKIQMIGGSNLAVDGEKVNVGQKFVWKGSMLQDVPNLMLVVGYTNASWTLGADATARAFCRLVKYMERNHITSSVPTVEKDSAMKPAPLLNLDSTYVRKASDTLPHAGDRGPWKARRNYFADLFQAKFGNITDGLQFFRASV